MSTWGSNDAPLTFRHKVSFSELSGASAQVEIPVPKNIVGLAAHIEFDGTSSASNPDTDGLYIAVADTVGAFSFGWPLHNFLGQAAGRCFFGASGGGFRGTDTVRMTLTAKLLPDGDGELSHITGLTSITFVLRYLPA